MTTTTGAPAPAPAETARAPRPGRAPRPVRAKRSPARFALAIALIALGTLTAVWYTTSLSKTTQVVAVASDVPYGTALQATDLTLVDMPATPSGLKVVDAADLDSMVGKFATRDLYAGGLLAPDAVADELVPAADTSMVGVQLESAQMPAIPLQAGRHVRVVETPAAQGDVPSGDMPSYDAIVLGTSAAPSGTATIVNLQVSSGDAAAVAARAAAGRLALVVDSGKAF